MYKTLFAFLITAAPLLAQTTAFGPEVTIAAGAPDWKLQTTYNFGHTIAAEAGRVHMVWWEEAPGGGALVNYRRSSDDGLTFGPKVTLSDPGYRCEHPSISTEGNNVYVVYHSYRPAPAVYVRRSSDGGVTWSPERALTGAGHGAAHGSVSSKSFNRVHVVSGGGSPTGYAIYHTSSTDGGKTWSPETSVVTSTYPAWVATVLDQGLEVRVAYVDTRDGNEEEYMVTSNDGGATWGVPQRVTANVANSWAPSLGRSYFKLHHAWFDQRDVPVTMFEMENTIDVAMRLLKIVYNPTTPMPGPDYYYQDVLTRTGQKLAQVMAAAPAWVAAGGDPNQLQEVLGRYTGMLNLINKEWEIYYRSFDLVTRTWSEPRRLTTAAGGSLRPVIAATVYNRTISIVWFDDRDGNYEVYYMRSDDEGATWGPQTRLTFAAGGSTRPHVAHGASGSVHVMWEDTRNGQAVILYRRGN